MTTVRDATTARRNDRAAVGWAWTGRNLILDEALQLGAIQVLRNAAGGGGGCQIFQKKSVMKV